MFMSYLRKAVALVLSWCFVFVTFSQKPFIDFNAIDSWENVDQYGKISPNGKFVAYGVNSNKGTTASVFLQAVDGSWRKEFRSLIQSSSAVFADNNNLYICAATGRAITIVSLGKEDVETIDNVESWQVKGDAGNEHLICKAAGKLFVRNLRSGNQVSMDSVKFYLSADCGTGLVYTTEHNEVFYWDFQKQKKILVYYSLNPMGGIVFDGQYKKVAFWVDSAMQGSTRLVKCVYSYDIAKRKLDLILNENSAQLATNYSIEDIVGYNTKGNNLVLSFKKISPASQPVSKVVDVCIWGYRDSSLQYFRPFSSFNQKRVEATVKGVIFPETGRLLMLENEDTVALPVGGDHWLIMVNSSNRFDAYWNSYVTKSEVIKLVDAGNGQVQDLRPYNALGITVPNVSPSGRYIVDYDYVRERFSSYRISDGCVTSLLAASSIPMPGTLSNNATTRTIGWIDGRELAVVQFSDDIYVLDPTGKKPPHRVTNSENYKNRMTFGLLSEKENEDNLYDLDKEYILAGFDKFRKTNSFYKVNLNSTKLPGLLTEQAALLWAPDVYFAIGHGFKPVKAAKADVYLVKRMRADQSANYYTTKDFITFRQLSFVRPEVNYNWLTAELFNVSLPDSSLVQGILYKPENFDSTRQYPLIMHYYETRSNDLHVFPVPERTDGGFDISWFVSRGYLVACVDIEYKIGWPGASANHCVNACAASLKKRAYVNEKKIGLYGHSFGGFETNYIVTHSYGFSAAVSSAGVSNLIEGYGEVWGSSGISKDNYTIKHQMRMGVAPWENPALYMENSPVLLANRVKTPMLFMHNINDYNVPFSQGRQFFTALRRCGSPSWLLQYDNSRHLVSEEQASDFTTRVTQFFDHYLKDQPMPCWMASKSEAQWKSACTE